MRLTKPQARILAALQYDNDRQYARGICSESPPRYIAGLVYFDDSPIEYSRSVAKNRISAARGVLDVLTALGCATTNYPMTVSVNSTPTFTITDEGRNVLRSLAGLEPLPPPPLSLQEQRRIDALARIARIQDSLRYHTGLESLHLAEDHLTCEYAVVSLDDLEDIVSQLL